MRFLFGFLLIAQAGAMAASGTAREGLDEGLVNPGYEEKPAWFKESFLDIREDLAEAAAEGKRLLLYFYQDGCPYCTKLLKDNFADQSIAHKTRQGFDVIAINMWGDREVTDLEGAAVTEKSFSKDLRIQFTPTLLFLDEKGEAVLRLNGYYPPHKLDVALDYVAGRHEKEISAADYLRRAAPSAATGRLHREPGFLGEPLELSFPRDRPLLVLFEQTQCLACDELHLDILQRPEVRGSLERLDVALVDMRSEEPVILPGGEPVPARQWASSLGIKYAPSLVFFDSQGAEVFRTEAYLRAFHVHGALDYVLSGAYREEPEFQRYLQTRRSEFEAQGIEVDLWE